MRNLKSNPAPKQETPRHHLYRGVDFKHGREVPSEGWYIAELENALNPRGNPWKSNIINLRNAVRHYRDLGYPIERTLNTIRHCHTDYSNLSAQNPVRAAELFAELINKSFSRTHVIRSQALSDWIGKKRNKFRKQGL